MNRKTKQALLVIPCLVLYRAIVLSTLKGPAREGDVLIGVATNAIPISILVSFCCATFPDKVAWRAVALLLLTPVVGLCILALRQYSVNPQLLRDFAGVAYFPFATWFVAGLATLISTELLGKTDLLNASRQKQDWA